MNSTTIYNDNTSLYHLHIHTLNNILIIIRILLSCNKDSYVLYHVSIMFLSSLSTDFVILFYAALISAYIVTMI